MQNNDLISRAAARDVINTWGRNENEDVRMDLLHNDLNAIPAVDAAQRTYTFNIGNQPSSFECFACRLKCRVMPDDIVEYRYCPMCGAKVLRIASEDEIFKGAKRVEIPSVKKREKVDGGDNDGE